MHRPLPRRPFLGPRKSLPELDRRNGRDFARLPPFGTSRVIFQIEDRGRVRRGAYMTPRAAATLAWGLVATLAVVTVTALVVALVRGEGSDTFLLIVLVLPVVGAVVASRQPRNPIGWILIADGIAWALVSGVELYADYAYSHPGSLPRPDIALAFVGTSWVPAVGLLGTFLILLFPDGRLPSPRWRWWAWFCAAVIVGLYLLGVFAPATFADYGYPNVDNPLGIEALRPLLDHIFSLVLLVPVCIVGCAVGLVQRFRRSRGEERQQLKWLTAAGAIVAVVYLALMFGGAIWSLPKWAELGILTFFLIPIAIAIAILKHRLYDIDLIINRALVYGSLTGALTLCYLLLVTVLQEALRPFAGTSQLSVAGSTLAVAALFRPARVRIQSFIDRRFYRTRYNATQILGAFSSRLRDEMDLDALRVEITAAVGETMQPRQISLWLRDPETAPQIRSS